MAAPGIPAGTTNYIYYDSRWQPIETRTNGTANTNVTSRMVWPASYINAAVLEDTYSAGAIQPNSRLYFQQDANWDTTAVIGYNSTTQAWSVAQRYAYSPYGNITILNPDFTTAPTGTQTLANNLYQGMALDPVTGLYYERARWYRTGQAGLRQEPKSSRRIGTGSVHREISQDPLSYINGANTYQFVGDGPVGRVDASGLAVLYGVVDPTGSAFGVFPNSGGHAIIVISDPASPSGWLVYSFQLGGWHEYDFNQYRNKPYNRHRPIELWALPGASARLARADVERQIKHGNDTYARGAKVCSTASAEVAAAATVGKPIHGDIDSFRSSTVNGTGEPRQYPNALPRYLVQQGDIPPSGIHNYPAPGGQAAGGSSSGSSSASSGSSSSSSGGFWHWIASWF